MNWWEKRKAAKPPDVFLNTGKQKHYSTIFRFPPYHLPPLLLARPSSSPSALLVDREHHRGTRFASSSLLNATCSLCHRSRRRSRSDFTIIHLHHCSSRQIEDNIVLNAGTGCPPSSCLCIAVFGPASSCWLIWTASSYQSSTGPTECSDGPSTFCLVTHLHFLLPLWSSL